MIKLLRYLRVAIESILANKLRASLTMLGIIIGVAAVLTTMGIGAGAAASITANIQRSGVNLLTVNSGGGNDRTANLNTLTLNDAAVLADQQLHPELTAVSPEYSAQAQLVNNENSSQNQAVGVTLPYSIVHNLDIAQGRFFTQMEIDEWQRNVVLGSSVATTLFPNSEPLGATIRIGGNLFKVIGVLASSGGGGFGSNDNRVFVPLPVAQGLLFSAPRYRGQLTVSSIALQVKDATLMDRAQTNVEQTLRLRHGLQADDDNDFTILNQASLLEIAGSISQTLTVFLGSIAAVSLLVGGIGIMNIMLVSVTERTKEIGLRRALGAHDSDILLQFLIEALMLCLLGGAIGIGLSLGVGIAVSSIPGFPFQVIFQTSAIGLALGVCTACGFVFGLYPALRATRLDPIEALRYE